jgi:hypothetical protein
MNPEEGESNVNFAVKTAIRSTKIAKDWWLGIFLSNLVSIDQSSEQFGD